MTTEPMKAAALEGMQKGASPASVQALALNAAMRELDAVVQRQAGSPEMQMGILMMAQVLAFRRVLTKNGIVARGLRHRLARKAADDFVEKLRRHGMDFAAPIDTGDAVNTSETMPGDST